MLQTVERVFPAKPSTPELCERGSLVHRDVVRGIALDLVLRVVPARAHRVALELRGRADDARDRSSHVTGLRVPRDVIPALEPLRRHSSPRAREWWFLAKK